MFIKFIIEEGIRYVKLIDFPAFINSYLDEDANRSHLCHWAERFKVIYFLLLLKTWSHQACFVVLYSAISILLSFEHPSNSRMLELGGGGTNV